MSEALRGAGAVSARSRAWPRRRRRGFRLFAVQVGVIVLVAAVAAGIAVVVQAEQIQQESEDRIAVLAQTVAAMPIVVDGMRSDDPTATIQPVTTAMTEAAGVDYISVVDMAGVRVAHPLPELVGQQVSSDHSDVRAGNEFFGTEEGPVGLTLRAKVPIRTAAGEIVGTVSVGLLVSEIRRDVAWRAGQISLPTLGAVLIGLFVAWRVTAGLRRRLYGVEPDDMLALVQARQAVSDGIQDGFIGVDDDGRIAFVNSGARRLLDLPAAQVGDVAADALPEPVAELLATDDADPQQVSYAGRTLVVTRSAATADGRAAGTTLVVQDRSELEGTLERLADERARGEALRVEAHDFDNRMHVIAGLLGLGELEDARSYLASLPRAQRPGGAREWSRIDSPLVAALLASRQAQAEAAGIDLVLTEDSRVTRSFACGEAEVTVLGNLLSNAIEAARSSVEVFVAGDAEGLEVVVDDDGRGVPAGDAERVFAPGTTSKATDAWRHGIGLDVVRRHVEVRGGEIMVGSADLGGARFQVELPRAQGVASGREDEA